MAKQKHHDDQTLDLSDLFSEAEKAIDTINEQPQEQEEFSIEVEVDFPDEEPAEDTLDLDAELAAHQGKVAQAEKDYRRAITLSARGGFLREAGLASERYARLLRYVHKPPQRKDALFHLDRAIDFYSSWESPRKVSMLKQLRSESYVD